MTLTSRICLLMAIAALGGCSLGPGLHLGDAFKSDTTKEVSADAKGGEAGKNASQETQAGAARAIQYQEPKLILVVPQLIENQTGACNEKTMSGPGLQTWGQEARHYQYHVGPGGVLAVTIWEHPELTLQGSQFRTPFDAGAQVRSDGTIFYPYVGSVPVAGKTSEEIRALMTARLRKYLANPQLDVWVADFCNQHVYVTGETAKSGVLPIADRPMSVMDAVNLSGGATANADLSQVLLAHGKEVKVIDVLALYRGESASNSVLQDGDQIHVSDNFTNQVFVLGEVSKPSVEFMDQGQLTLVHELTAAGGPDPLTSDPSRIYVIWGDMSHAKVYQLDVNSANVLMLSTLFQLQARDVVYVSAKDISDWSRTVSQILPTVSVLWQTDNLIKNL